MSGWFVKNQNNRESGPFSSSQIRAMVQNGEIQRNDRLKKQDGQQWAPATSVKGLFPAQATKTCPFCAEEILLAAKKCKHCGELVEQSFSSAGRGSKKKVPAKLKSKTVPGCALVFGLIWIPVVLLIRAAILDAQWDAGMNSDDFWHKFVFAGGFVAAALGLVMFFWGALEFSRRSGR